MAARKAKLGLSLAGFAVEQGAGVRAELARRATCEAVQAAARAGVDLFSGDEGSEPFMAEAGQPRVTLRLISDGLGADQVEGRVAMVRDRLGRLAAPDILIDGARLLAADGDAVWEAAQRLSGAGLCGALGVSVEAGGDALGLARRFKPDLMQVCASLLDQRLIVTGALSDIAALGVEVHLRTALLHGLLFLPREGLPAAVAEAGPLVSRVRRAIAEGGADPLQAALAFALDRPEASGVIVEAASAGEVRAALAAAAAPSPQLDWPALALDHPAALDAEARLGRRAA